MCVHDTHMTDRSRQPLLLVIQRGWGQERRTGGGLNVQGPHVRRDTR